MKRKGILIVSILVLIAGIGTYFYPGISDMYYQAVAVSEINGYQKGIGKLSEEETADMLARAEEFNSRLSETLSTDPFKTGEVDPYKGDQVYNSLLNINGVLGYIDIPGIDVYLPVYHGTSPSVLKKGAGHLYGSALPVGGEGTHSVISAHRGLPSAELFTDLDSMKEGDIFYFHILDRIMAYQVDRIETVEPTELERLDPEPEGEYMTLLTCTPYGINSHRLLVRGVRIPYEITTAEAATEQIGVNGPKLKASLPLRIKIAAAGAAATVIILLAAIIYMYCRKRRETGEEKR